MKRWDYLFFVGGIIVLATSGAWFGPAALRAPYPVPGGPEAGQALIESELATVVVEKAVWPEPPSQTGGEDWLFEVFTPPVIYFDEATRSFRLTPPIAPPDPEPFGLEVATLRREPYRLQYGAHHGVEGNYLIEIHDLKEDEWYRGRVGQRIDDAGCVITRFRAWKDRVQPEVPGATPYVVDRVELVLQDLRENAEVVLGREQKLREDITIGVELHNGTRASMQVREPLVTGDATYLITRLDYEANLLTVQRISAHDPSEVREETFKLPSTLFD